MDKRLKVILGGINGRMGKIIAPMLLDSQEFELLAAIGRPDASYIGKDLGDVINRSKTGIKIYSDMSSVLSDISKNGLKPDVFIDNSESENSIKLAKKALEQDIATIIGTSGLLEKDIEDLAKIANAKKIGVLIVPNFSLGAVLMMEFAQQAAKFFENVEIVEMHHTKKLDAPSGTAMHTMRKLNELQKTYNKKEIEDHELINGARGGTSDSGVRIHSLRLPGLISHQEVIFGSVGELLTIRHDSFNMDCFPKGVALALKSVTNLDGLVIGLDKILGMSKNSQTKALGALV